MGLQKPMRNISSIVLTTGFSFGTFSQGLRNLPQRVETATTIKEESDSRKEAAEYVRTSIEISAIQLYSPPKTKYEFEPSAATLRHGSQKNRSHKRNPCGPNKPYVPKHHSRPRILAQRKREEAKRYVEIASSAEKRNLWI